MKTLSSMLVLMLLMLTCCVSARAEVLVPGDFEAGLPLPDVREGGTYSLTLPLVVYDKVIRSDLGDLRVFNGAGEVVPHAFRTPEAKPEGQESRQSVPFFPLRCEREPLAGDLSLRVNRSAAGTVISVDAADILSNASSPASCTVLDVSQFTAAPSALELDWVGGPNALFAVRLTQSKDLTHWSPLISTAVLADLHHKSQAIAVRRIPLSSKPLAYVRIDCVDCQEPLQLRSVTAVFGTQMVPPEHTWLRLELPRMHNEGEEMVFEYAPVPTVAVTGLRLQLPEANSLARVSIESRTGSEASWRSRYTGVVYDLSVDGKRLTNEPVFCATTTDRHWRVRILHDGAGLGAQRPPRLELGWRGDQLIFVARGQGPYTLAFGSTKAHAVAYQQDNLILAALREARSESLIRPTEFGPMQTLGGENARKARLSGATWKKILLWVVLLGGVAVLAFMVRSIARDMKL